MTAPNVCEFHFGDDRCDLLGIVQHFDKWMCPVHKKRWDLGRQMNLPKSAPVQAENRPPQCGIADEYGEQCTRLSFRMIENPMHKDGRDIPICRPHYQRYRAGIPLPPAIRASPEGGVCTNEAHGEPRGSGACKVCALPQLSGMSEKNQASYWRNVPGEAPNTP